MKAAITAVAGYVPEKILTNKELESRVETTEQWILERTGIAERRILVEGEEPSSQMGVKVFQDLCKKRGIAPTEIDMLVVATATPDYPCPANGNIIAYQAGAGHIPSFDMNVACSGFVYALATASQFIETGKYKKVIVIGMDHMTSIIDPQDRNTCIIFGDGAGGVLLEPTEQGGIQDFILHSDGAGESLLYVPSGGSKKSIDAKVLEERSQFLKQDGRVVFKHAVQSMVGVTQELLARNQVKIDDLAWLVPHQANLRIIQTVGEQLAIPIEKVMINIQKYGNTTAATIPLCLWEYENKIKKSDRLVLVAFGGGFTWGAVYLEWMYG